jgi:hypothetical protein
LLQPLPAWLLENTLVLEEVPDDEATGGRFDAQLPAGFGPRKTVIDYGLNQSDSHLNNFICTMVLMWSYFLFMVAFFLRFVGLVGLVLGILCYFYYYKLRYGSDGV